MLSNGTKKKIDTARDILVGKIPMPTAQVEQITLALIYKFMADMDKKAKDLGDSNGFFANGYEKYAWDNIMDKSLAARERVTLYSEGLEKMSLNPHIPQLFRDIFRNAFLPFKDPETLKLFLDVIDQFEYDHSEELGNAFEYLLQVMGSQGDAGQFRTPRHIIDFIVDVVDPKKTDKILDPACGTAGFLISAYKHIKSNGLSSDEMKTISDNFVGYDISQDMRRLSLVNLYLHHFPDPHIYEYDTLTSEERWSDDFDVILANPPFMTPKGGIRPHNRFSVPSKRAEVLFVDYIMEHLTVHGRAGVIVPEGIIFQSQNAYKQLRKMMVDDDFLWAVVSLPSGVFQPYSGVKTSILLFDRELAKKTNKILFVKVENDGFDLGAQRRPIKKNDLPEATKILKEYKQSLVDGKDVDLERDDIVHAVKKIEIGKEGYNLSGEKYKILVRANKDGIAWSAINRVAETFCDGDWIEKKDQSTRGIRLIQTGNVGNGEYIDKKDKSRFISEQTFNSLSCTEVFQGDILISRLPDPVGRSCIVPLLGTRAITSVDCTIVRFDQQKVLNKFFVFLTKSDKYFSALNPFLTGSSRTRISRKNLGEVKIPLPPLSVQKEIVEELDRYQKIIDGARQVVDNYQPSFKIEDDWEWKKIGEFCQLSQGFAVNSKTSHAIKPDGDMPLLRIKDFINNNFEQRVDSSLVPEPTIINNEDLIYSRTGQVGLVFTGRSGVLHNNLFKIDYDKSIVLKDYLYYLLQSHRIKNEIISLSTRSAQPDVTHSVFKSVSVPIPPLNKQKELVDSINAQVKGVNESKKLIGIFESKVKSRIDDLWS